MQLYYSIQDAKEILKKDSDETILRYIRASVLKDKAISLDDQIATFEELGILKDYKKDKGRVFLTYENIKAITNNMFSKESKNNKEIKAILKDAYFSLVLKDADKKPYLITRNSLMLLITRQRMKLKKETFEEANEMARHIISEYDSSFYPNTESIIPEENYTDERNLLKKIFSNEEDQEKFLKGLYLLANIDNDFSQEEKRMIDDRVKLFGISPDKIKKWVPNPKEIDESSTLSICRFSNLPQATIFLREAITLAWKDGDYSQDEKELIKKFAKNNGLENKLPAYERTIEEEFAEEMFKLVGKFNIQ